MTSNAGSRQAWNAGTAALLVLPLFALALVIAVFLWTDVSTSADPAAPIENLTIERYALERGRIELHVRNSGPESVLISQVVINDAVWPFHVEPSSAIPRLARATVVLDYMWSSGEAYAVRILTSNAIPFDVEIPVAAPTPAFAPSSILRFGLIGLYVGVIPVFLGILWYPALRRMGRRALAFLLAATVGLLVFLGIDTLFEAREASLALPDVFQGVGLIAIGVISTVLLLEAIAARQRRTRGGETERRLAVASIIAVGIGFHNLGEGLAIGAAYSIGEFAFGRFLVVGFILQNITEGLGVVAPVARENPGLRRLILWGLVAGAPAILGTWLGGYAPSALAAVLFLAVGSGAILQVTREIWNLLRQDKVAQASPALVYAGVVVGMLVLWVTGLLIK